MMNDELFRQAKEKTPQSFINPERIVITNGVCVKRGYRNMGVLKFIADMGDLHA
jgi:hypothetical protein